MGHSAAGLARLRAMNNTFREGPALILEPTYGSTDFEDDAITGWTGTEHQAKLRMAKRIATPVASGGALSTVNEIGNFEAFLDSSVAVSKKAKYIGGGGAWKGAWTVGSFAINDVVSAGAKYYRASATITNEVPGTDAKWVLQSNFEIVGTNCPDTGRVKTILQMKEL